MILKVQLGMVCLVALHIIATDAICTSNESSALHCSHMVTPDITNDTCLNSSIPCCDISTYIKYSSFTSNTTFCFLNGTHIIDLVDYSMLMIEEVSNISLIGFGGLVQHSLRDKVNEYSFTFYEDDQSITFLQSPSIIQCKSSFAFIFNNVTNLVLQNLTIQNCGGIVTNIIMPIQGNDSFPIISSVAILMISVTNLIFENTSLQNSTGYGVVGINMLGYSQLVGSSFVGNNQYVKNTQLTKYYYQDILCNDGSCATPSVIYVTASDDGIVHYPGGNAIFIYNHLTNSSQIHNLKIESCLFTLGMDDSIPLKTFSAFTILQPFYTTMGTGLGILLFLGSSYSVPINITNTVSYRNQAWCGANFNFQEANENSIISLLNVTSTRGISPWNGGGSFYYSVDHPALSYDNMSSITFNGCIFSSPCSPGISLVVQNVRSLHVTECAIFGQLYGCCRNGIITITNSVLQTANCIGGIQMNAYNISISNCIFNGSGLISNYGTADVANSLFTNCQSSAVSLSYSSLQLRGNVSFTYNSAPSNGGALYLYQSNVIFQAVANITFINNSALLRGGAIYIAEDSIGSNCSLTFDDPDGNLSVPGIQIFIANSSAGVAGNVLYGGNIERCNFDCSKAPNYCDLNWQHSLIDIINAVTTYGLNNGNWSAMISSDATGVFHCVNDTAMFDTPLPISAYPGEKIHISIITVGQRYGASPDIVTYSKCDVMSCSSFNFYCGFTKCTTPSLKPTDVQPTHQYCTNYAYQVTGNSNKADMLLTLIIMRAYLETAYLSPYEVIININQCPFGFTNWSDELSICSADDVLVRHDIANDVQTSTVLRNSTIWIGNSSWNTSLAVHLHCPYDYCNPSSITFRITDEQDNQCNYNRTGVLCGGCKLNMSSVFGSNRCVPCADKLWLLVPFSIMGVTLVALLFLLNFTVSGGTINGLILYANIIAPGIVNRFPFSDSRIFIFISWLNINLGIETCFYNGMNTIVKTWLQFVFPVYILLLVGAFVLTSRWSSLLTRLCRRNAVAVLATLILLSYTKILETVITVLVFTEIDAGNSTANNPPVWLADGTVLYAQGEHAWLLAVCFIVIIIFLVPYTLILLLAPWIQKRSHWNVFSWINKLKPFLDAYQAPFKDQYRYWPGVLLMVRVVLYLVFIINEGNNINANLLTIALVLWFYALITNRLAVHKYWLLNFLENYFIINLIFLSCTLLYIKDAQTRDSDGVKILKTSGGISLIVFIGIILYHFSVQLKDNRCLKSVSQMIKGGRPLISPSSQDDVSEKYTSINHRVVCRESILECS